MFSLARGGCSQVAILILPIKIVGRLKSEWNIFWKSSYFCGYIDVVDGSILIWEIIGYIDVGDVIIIFGYSDVGDSFGDVFSVII